MYVTLSVIPLWLSATCTLTPMLLLVFPFKLTFTTGGIVSSIVVCWISLVFVSVLSVNLEYTVSPCFSPVMLCPLVIVVHWPDVPPIWYCNVYPDSVVEIGISAVPSPCHCTSPNVMVLSGISTAPVPSCTVIVFSIVVSPVVTVTFIS